MPLSTPSCLRGRIGVRPSYASPLRGAAADPRDRFTNPIDET
ncbi:hypothetical protein [Halobiforma nitratireducens]|nr:hypothetical protein [Halobiforma nitratireducens]